MCGIAGLVGRSVPQPVALDRARRMASLISHRGPDGCRDWAADGVGLAHARLAIIDLVAGDQPMASDAGAVISYNGEIYNYLELRDELGGAPFRTTSDTEVILRAYDQLGERCVQKLRGMFAFAIWDPRRQALFIARDRFGIKPFYYTVAGGTFYFASEAKALLPFRGVETDIDGLHDYLSFQFCLGDKTMFDGIRQLRPAHCGWVTPDGDVQLRHYWEVEYALDWSHDEQWFVDQVQSALRDSVRVHLRSDVEVGAYLSGGVDSSLMTVLAREANPAAPLQGFTGKFAVGPEFDESQYARAVAEQAGVRLHEIAITEADFVAAMPKVIYHLDYPVAGPGSFPQYMVAQTVAEHVKVVLGGQGGDEVFGGYARYLIAYWEQCIKGAIEGTMDSGNFVVTYQSIIPNLQTLRSYKPLIQEFWADGIFEERDRRYYRLINRANTFGDTINWKMFAQPSSFAEFREIFWGRNVGKESYFDSMTHFDFKTLLPALLQVEDRMSMAHGVESRVPMLDHRLVELAATIPANIKFQNGELKRLLRVAFADQLPRAIRERKDKMGFPVPIQKWVRAGGVVREFLLDTFRSQRARQRSYLTPGFDIEALMAREGPFSRNIWAVLSLELWQQQFHDRPAAVAAAAVERIS
jgi:asparagine synthase (glutamine-hydrolysing)